MTDTRTEIEGILRIHFCHDVAEDECSNCQAICHIKKVIPKLLGIVERERGIKTPVEMIRVYSKQILVNNIWSDFGNPIFLRRRDGKREISTDGIVYGELKNDTLDREWKLIGYQIRGRIWGLNNIEELFIDLLKDYILRSDHEKQLAECRERTIEECVQAINDDLNGDGNSASMYEVEDIVECLQSLKSLPLNKEGVKE